MSAIRLLRTGPIQHVTQTIELPHVLLVLDQLPRSLGGGERIVLRMAELLPAYGYRVSILTFAADELSSALVAPPCPLYLLPLQRTYDLKALCGAIALRRFLEREQIVIVHTCFESSDLWAGSMTKLLSDAKLVWNRRDMGILRRRQHKIAYRRLCRLPDAVFAVSEEVRGYSIEVDHLPPERVITVHNGLDLSVWPQSQPLAELQTFASLGNIRHVKGQDVLLQAFSLVILEFPQAKLVLGGAVLEANFKRDLDCIVKEHGLEASVRFAGPINDQQSFLQKASFFVMPSRSEGFSNAIIEAMASSLPVIATDVGGNAEAVNNEETGILVPVQDAAAMASAMIRLLRDPLCAARMGQAGRKRVVEHFTIEAMMTRVASTFDRLC